MNKNLRNFTLYWLPLVVWLLVIFVASTDLMSAEHTSRIIGPFMRWLIPDLTPAAIAKVQLIVRKGAHVTEYAILAGFLARAFLHGVAKITTRHALSIWLLCTANAALDEWHQTFVGSRTGSPIDVMIDSAGVLAGLGIYWLLARRRSAAR
ncbi:MAG: VanZ family protein [Chthoniobacterales bacterium]